MSCFWPFATPPAKCSVPKSLAKTDAKGWKSMNELKEMLFIAQKTIHKPEGLCHAGIGDGWATGNWNQAGELGRQLAFLSNGLLNCSSS